MGELTERNWRIERQRPGRLHCRAMRAIMGWSQNEAASRAGVAPDVIRYVETEPEWHVIGVDGGYREAVHRLYAGVGLDWGPVEGKGAYITAARPVSDAEAIHASLALLGRGAITLVNAVRRRAGEPTADRLRLALRTRGPLGPVERQAAFSVLRAAGALGQRRAHCE